MKLPLLVLVGPTAVGKTALSVDLAERLGGEIISGDSMQVYRGMDIGTAKITPAEMRGVPHHLIDIKSPDEPYSVAEFQSQVDQLIRAIHGRGRLPMLVGGTGLYVRAVVQEYTFSEQETDHGLRAELAEAEAKNGPGYLHGQLAAVDPEAAARLHPNDLRRIIRALEVYTVTGVPISQTQVATQAERRYDDLFLGLTMDRELLYGRIDQRVEQMITLGLAAEVQGLLQRYDPHLPAMEAIGYRETVQYLRGLLNMAEATALIKRNTRRFAKRQFTWFKKEPGVTWFDLSTPADRNAILDKVTAIVEGKWRKAVEAH
ncbi:MAG: tRNA (adenosine(37)-N6)-dimethylallyltransferase MiaA [Mycobacterium leprae]